MEACYAPNTCQEVPGWFESAASSLELATAAGCCLNHQPGCHGEFSRIDENSVSLKDFDDKLVSLLGIGQQVRSGEGYEHVTHMHVMYLMLE